MTDMHSLDQSTVTAVGLAVVGAIGTLVVYLVRISSTLARALTRFEMIGETQSKDISELKTTVAKLGELLIQQAQTNGRLDGQAQRMTQLELATNQRFEDLNHKYKQLWDLFMELRQGKGMVLPDPPKR
jgi:hypothetical protein